MPDRENVIKALECRKNAEKRCGNPCEDTGLCHYAKAVRDLDGEIYRPFICDRERICADAISLLKEQEEQIKNRNESLEKARKEIEWLRGILKEQEAKTGKWILDDEDANSWECSECGGLLLINDGTPHENDWNYCPYCGSKLEEQAVKWDDD